MKLFYDNITIKSLFKNKLLNIQGYFGSFSKKIIKSNSIPSNSSQFWKVKIWDFMGIEMNEYSLLPIPFFPT